MPCKLAAAIGVLLSGWGCGNCVDKGRHEEDNESVSRVPNPGMDRIEFRCRRKAAGVTMREAGELLGVSERTIWRWEHGRSAIDPWKAQAIRDTLIPGMWAKGKQQDT